MFEGIYFLFFDIRSDFVGFTFSAEDKHKRSISE